MPQKTILIEMAAIRHLDFENFHILSHLTVIEFQICSHIPNVINIG